MQLLLLLLLREEDTDVRQHSRILSVCRKGISTDVNFFGILEEDVAEHNDCQARLSLIYWRKRSAAGNL